LQAGHLDGVGQAFRDACASVGNVRELAFRFAGRPVRIRAAGAGLAEILYRCFEPLALSGDLPGSPALSVHAWDRAETGVGCPGIPFAPDVTDPLGPGLMHQYDGGRILRYDLADVVSCFDRAGGQLYLHVTDSRKLRLEERSKPFQFFLATWYMDGGVQLIHAGAVARQGRAVLFGGMNGSGKSTSAIACALAGFDFLADDTVGIAVEESRIAAYACYNGVRCGARALGWFPQLEAVSMAPTRPSPRPKNLAYMSDLCPGRIPAEASVVAVAAVRIVGEGVTTLTSASKASILRRLAPSTLLRGLGAGSKGFAEIAEMTRRLPCYDLAIGADVADVPGLVDRLLSDLEP
jgi:hypothetical protein